MHLADIKDKKNTERKEWFDIKMHSSQLLVKPHIRKTKKTFLFQKIYNFLFSELAEYKLNYEFISKNMYS